jgi:hypothetical protein
MRHFVDSSVFLLNIFLLSVDWNALEKRINRALRLITCEVTV